MARSPLPLGVALLLLGGCHGDPGPEVTAAKEIGVLAQGAEITGRDGGQSGLAFGKSVWTFGDTVLAMPDAAGSSWHHNSYAVTDDVRAADGITGLSSPTDSAGAPVYLIAPSPTEQAFNDAHAGDACAEKPCGARWAVWPGPPAFDAARGRAIIPYGLIYAEPGDFNFHGVGQSFATWDSLDDAPVRPLVDATAEHPDLVFAESERGYGIAPIIDGDDLFVFACDGDGLSKPCRLAKVPLDHLHDHASFRYFDGSAWSAQPGDAKALFDGSSIMSVSRSDHLGGWMVVCAPPLDHRVVARTAPDLTGPWSEESTLYTAPEDHAPYDAVHHVELQGDGGRVQYLTYSRPTTGWFGSEFALVEVTLK
jgi:hypothetical protein